MPVLDTSRKQESEVIAGFSSDNYKMAVNKSFATVTLTGTGKIAPLGQVIAFNDSDAWEILSGTTTVGSGDSDLPNGALYAVVVGDKYGRGVNREDVALPAQVTVMFRDGAVKAEGLEFGAGADEAAAHMSLEKQGIVVVASATDVDPSHEDI